MLPEANVAQVQMRLVLVIRSALDEHDFVLLGHLERVAFHLIVCGLVQSLDGRVRMRVVSTASCYQRNFAAADDVRDISLALHVAGCRRVPRARWIFSFSESARIARLSGHLSLAFIGRLASFTLLLANFAASSSFRQIFRHSQVERNGRRTEATVYAFLDPHHRWTSSIVEVFWRADGTSRNKVLWGLGGLYVRRLDLRKTAVTLEYLLLFPDDGRAAMIHDILIDLSLLVDQIELELLLLEHHVLARRERRRALRGEFQMVPCHLVEHLQVGLHRFHAHADRGCADGHSGVGVSHWTRVDLV